MEGSKYPAWQKAYHEALLELDPQRLSERIHAAEELIASRLGELRIGPKNAEEQQALLDARSALLVIQRPNPSSPKRTQPVRRSGIVHLVTPIPEPSVSDAVASTNVSSSSTVDTLLEDYYRATIGVRPGD